MAFLDQAYAFQNVQGSTFVFLTYLNWQLREGGDDDIGELISPIGTSNPSVTLLDAPFDWNSGFRVGGGYKSAELWDAVIYLTSYNTKANTYISAPGQLYSPYIGNFFQNNTNGRNNGPFYNAEGLRWDFNYNIVDLELGRHFIIDQILTLRPFIGLKMGTIHHNLLTSWFGPNTLIAQVPTPITSFTAATENLTQKFTGVGPSFGLDTSWSLHQFSQSSIHLIGDFSAALLWGIWRFTDQYQTNGASSVTVTVDNVNGATPVTRAFIGLGWVQSFSTLDLETSLGYEAQIWFDEVQYNTLSSGRLSDIMSLQGLVLNVAVNF